MSDVPVPALPEIFAAIDLTAYAVAYEGERSTWGRQRPWRFTCRACGKILHPLPTARAVYQMQYHSTIRGGQPVVCRRGDVL